MPYVDDFWDQRRDRQMAGATPEAAPGAPGASVGAPTSAPGASAAQAPAAGGGHGTGFVNLERYIGANQGGAQGMANAIGGRVAQQGQQTLADAANLQGQMAHSTAATAAGVDPALQARLGAEATQATLGAQALQTPGGIGALLTQQYGTGGGYGSGMRGFDSFLTGAAGGNQFQALGNQYGGLDKYVSGLGGTYSPQVVSTPGAGIHGGPGSHAPIAMGPSAFAAPPGVAGPPSGGSGGGSGTADQRRKRRTA